jgi:DNA-damage-inducible protein J
MANSLIQFRIDDVLRQQANELCVKLGLDLSTFLRMCLAKLVQEQGVPFPVRLNLERPVCGDALDAMQKLSDLSRKKGKSRMTLREINAEISAARDGR